MVDERTAYWGARDAARYRTQDDDPTGGDYVVAETLDANGDPVDVLLRWDDTAGEWVSGGPVNMNGSDVTNVGALDADSVSTGELSSNFRFASPSDDLQSVIDSLESEVGAGTVYLIGGTHTLSGVTIPEGIEVNMGATGEWAQDEGTHVEPDADATIFTVKPGGKLSNGHIDKKAVTGYSSDVVRVTAENSAGTFVKSNPTLEKIRFSGDFDTANAGSAVHIEDTDGSGMGWLTIRDLEITYHDTAIKLTATASGAYVNAFRAENIYISSSSTGVEENGTTQLTYYDLDVQGQSKMSKIIDASGPTKLRLNGFDSFAANQDLVTINDTGQDYSSSIEWVGREQDARTWFDSNHASPISFVGDKHIKKNWVTTSPVPSWLTDRGTGSTSIGGVGATITTGTTSGDTRTIDNGGTSMFFYDDTRNPFLTSIISPSTSGAVSRFGLRNNTGDFEAAFVADPEDTLGTGITSNWIFRVVDPDGTVRTNTDTGTAIGEIHPEVLLVGDNGVVVGNYDGTRADRVDLNSRANYPEPFVEVETTVSSAKSLDINRVLTLSYYSKWG